MQTATGYVVLSPENKQLHRGITPAQALILRKLHFSNSQGNPLEGLVIDGEAMEKKPDGNLRPRTNNEEIARLKRHYTGVVDGKRAFEAVFGNGSLVQLPQTFEEIADDIGDVIVGAQSDAPAPAAETDAPAGEWTNALNEELVALETTFRPTKEQKQRLAELRDFKAQASNVKR